MLRSPWIRTPIFPPHGQFNYDDYWRERGWAVAEVLKPREIIIRDMIPAGAKVIDIGCGASRLPVALKEKGVQIEVADVSSKVLEGYRQFGISGRVLDLRTIASQKFDTQYDFIIMSEVLEHTTNPEEVVLTLKKYTRQFILTIPNSAAYMFRYGLLVRGRFFTQWVMHPSEHLRFWSHIDFLDWLSALGLRVTRTEVSDGFTVRGLLPWLPRMWKNLLAFRVVYQCDATQS